MATPKSACTTGRFALFFPGNIVVLDVAMTLLIALNFGA
jgi:hypothetical protein